ncbi:MAG: hypothetical protein V3S62_04505 [Acidimicrobiia bacterium]
MHRRTWSAIFMGGTLGAILGLAVIALVGGRVIGSGVGTVLIEGEPARATFLVSQGALYILVIVASSIGGAIIAAVGFAAGKLAGPESERFALRPLVVIGAIIGTVIGFAAARTAIGVGGSITAEVVSLSVFRAAIVAIVTGAVVGTVVGGTVERVGRPEVFGFSGSAWPANPVAFLRDAMAAMGLPTLALVVSLAVVFVLSRVLLEADKTTSLIVFGGSAAIVLFGAAAIAALPPRGKRD